MITNFRQIVVVGIDFGRENSFCQPITSIQVNSPGPDPAHAQAMEFSGHSANAFIQERTPLWLPAGLPAQPGPKCLKKGPCLMDAATAGEHQENEIIEWIIRIAQSGQAAVRVLPER